VLKVSKYISLIKQLSMLNAEEFNDAVAIKQAMAKAGLHVFFCERCHRTFLSQFETPKRCINCQSPVWFKPLKTFEERQQQALQRRKQYYLNHRDEYACRGKNRKRNLPLEAKSIKKNYDNNREKWLARDKAYRGAVIGSNCESCGASENLERHHPDYTKPLEIKTLCFDCHRKQYRKYT
jgi:hypothetical protein